MCYGCGLRRSEAQDLNIKDVNFEQKLLFVRKGKGKKRRVIPLTEAIVKDLKDYFSYTEIVRKEGEESFLVNIYGNKIKGGNVLNYLKEYSKEPKV